MLRRSVNMFFFVFLFFNLLVFSWHSDLSALKALANDDTLLPTQMFPVFPRAQHLLRTQILYPGLKKCSDFVQKHFVSTTNVAQFA